jgi:hypothetical protein
MNCTNCDNPIVNGAKFCGECGNPIDSTAEDKIVANKAVSGLRVFIGIIVALLVFGILAKALMVIINIGSVLLFDIDSTIELENIEALANILGFVGGAYLASLVYVVIAGKDRSGEKKKWYQFAGFMGTRGRTKARSILAGVILLITLIAADLGIETDSLYTTESRGERNRRGELLQTSSTRTSN